MRNVLVSFPCPVCDGWQQLSARGWFAIACRYCKTEITREQVGLAPEDNIGRDDALPVYASHPHDREMDEDPIGHAVEASEARAIGAKFYAGTDWQMQHIANDGEAFYCW